MNKTALRTGLYALVVFIAGLATGVIVAPAMHHAFMRPPDSAQVAEHVLGKLSHKLDLTAEQKVQVKPIVEKTGADVEAIWHETADQIASRIEQGDRQIGTVLTKEQQPKLEAMIVENRERIRQHLPGGHHHHPVQLP